MQAPPEVAPHPSTLSLLFLHVRSRPCPLGARTHVPLDRTLALRSPPIAFSARTHSLSSRAGVGSSSSAQLCSSLVPSTLWSANRYANGVVANENGLVARSQTSSWLKSSSNQRPRSKRRTQRDLVQEPLPPLPRR